MFNKKQIPCPACGYKRLIDGNKQTKMKLISEDMFVTGTPYDLVQKCKHCKREIYILKVS